MERGNGGGGAGRVRCAGRVRGGEMMGEELCRELMLEDRRVENEPQLFLFYG